MKIEYARRSKFLEDSETAILTHRSDLDAGRQVYAALEKGGYDGCIVVKISRSDRKSFEAEWDGSHPSRFPVRIKAAATALRNCGCEGKFLVSHENGSLVVRSCEASDVSMRQNGSTVYLVSCVSGKRKQACAARDLYNSVWFRLARQYTEESSCPWFILSAKHGLVMPDQVIAPYDRTLKDMLIADRRAWAESVARQLAVAAPALSQVVFLAGERYREFLARHLAERGVAVSIPMKGLRNGEQMSWLMQHSPRPVM